MLLLLFVAVLKMSPWKDAQVDASLDSPAIDKISKWKILCEHPMVTAKLKLKQFEGLWRKSTLSPAAKLRAQTRLNSSCSNITRWISTCEMLRRFAHSGIPSSTGNWRTRWDGIKYARVEKGPKNAGNVVAFRFCDKGTRKTRLVCQKCAHSLMLSWRSYLIHRVDCHGMPKLFRIMISKRPLLKWKTKEWTTWVNWN